ncbi:glycerophosphodiester phosphodiesterase family protein [Pseudoruegeria sp. SK021]|uniref:glycerophosphodiester phosphodiesterase family protein n=1 Tax=Pseudoruegeria sp. SK021 TaxID=1933035 RepID=UPI000A245950|nr:glycerophosphodiester phosphodiesterase family protein [Pseudoruegeria sp. SK021]OSP54176.1 hypothetical protein BV911_14070 [Pseudoruegeria sp. SK021]
MIQSPALDQIFLARPLAHRGYHDAAAARPENSAAAMTAAVRAGYGIELDVQLSSDGGAMVFHDADLNRMTTATGPVRDRSKDALNRITLTQSNEPIPALTDILQLVAGRTPILIELKDQTADGGHGGPSDNLALAQAVAQDLAGYDGPAAVMSFNPDIVILLAQLLPDRARGLTTDSYRPEQRPADHSPADWAALRDMAGLAPSGATFISHSAADLARPRVQALRTQGMPVLCWTIRSREAEAAARRLADNITFEGYPAPRPNLDPIKKSPT